jgi:DNA-binding PadR family transcriptional regulator
VDASTASEHQSESVITTDANLPLTAYATLGLLTLRDEFTAAEIEERAYRCLRFFYWTPAPSHIRRELNRLEDLGYVECREVMRGRVKRALKYWQTPAGAAAVKAWVESSVVERTVKKNTALLRLWLGRRSADPDTVLDAFQTHIQFVKAERQSLNDYISTLEYAYRDRASEADQASPPEHKELRRNLARRAWHIAVMRYCLREYDNELNNLGQLMADMRKLVDTEGSVLGNRLPTRQKRLNRRPRAAIR